MMILLFQRVLEAHDEIAESAFTLCKMRQADAFATAFSLD